MQMSGGVHLILDSTAFKDQGHIPSQYTADGADLSPPLMWESVPSETLEFAVIVEDPDAPSELPWIHWVVYNIPASLRNLPEGIKPYYPGISQGLNSWGEIGYRGPNPPPGKVHHYRFTLYALNLKLTPSKRVTASELAKSMRGHILDRQILTGCYLRYLDHNQNR
jgi:Raf kinase inhibitor-like YbhB/YbcL family protein